MIRIAVVGDIGSGKSYCAKLFGYPVFNADIEVYKIYKKDKKCYKKFKKALPKYINFFPIKKKELNKAIMANKTNLKKIIRIVHPEIRARLRRFVIKHKYKKFIVLDIPLLIENKINKKSDILVFVDSKRSEINKRLKKRPNYNASIFRKLKKLQLPLEIKKKKSNFIIKNNFQRKNVKKYVKNLMKKILLYA
jgi:dephospho-CoA kinase